MTDNNMDDQSSNSHNFGHAHFQFKREVVQDLSKIVGFMREDQDHVVFRRFERLNLYNLLALQHRLTLLDAEVARHEQDQNAEALAAVLPLLEHLIRSYNDAYLAHEQMEKLRAPPSSLKENLKKHSEHNLIELKHELEPEDGWSELVSLVSRPKGWIHRFVDRHYWLQKVFRKNDASNCHRSILLYSETGVRRTEQALVNIVFCFLVLGPIFALSYISSQLVKLLVVLGSVLITSVLASSLSDQGQKSNLAVMVGYTAILVVFLSNSGART